MSDRPESAPGSKLRLALVVDFLFFPTNHTGANRFNCLVRELSQRHDVSVFATNESHPHLSARELQTLASREFAIPAERFVYLRRGRLDRHRLIARFFQELHYAARFLRLLHRHGPFDVVLVTTPPLLQLYVFSLLRFTERRAQLVIDVRDLIWNYFEYRRGPVFRVSNVLFRFMARWSLRRFNMAICTTSMQVDEIRALLPDQPVHLLRNGIEGSRFAQLAALAKPPAGQPLRVTYLGTVGYPQNLSTFIEAARLCAADPTTRGVEFVLAGDGSEWAALHKTVETQHLGNVRFLDKLDWDACLERVYGPANVLYAQLRGHPAFNSALPTKLFEYLASGRPIIYGGLDGESSRLLRAFSGVQIVPPDDPQRLYEAIKGFALSPRVNGFEANREILGSQFLREKLSAEYVRLLEEVARRQDRHSEAAAAI